MTGAGGDPAEAVARFFDPVPSGPIGIAVSGGSDSLALMHLLHDWARDTRCTLRAVTVDHGLRPEAAEEAAFVGGVAEGLGIPHETLRWIGWDGSGNLPDRARRARYALMADWGRNNGIAGIALGHTADDQAETLLMRLARGAGAEGLAAMSPRRDQGGVSFLRPLLAIRRDTLRKLLTERGQTWVEDPSNEDIRFDRPKARQALSVLAPLGLTVEALTTTAANLRRVSDTVSHYAGQEARAHVRFEAGDVVIPLDAYRDMPREIARRILQAALAWVSGAEYPPRREAMERLMEALGRGEGMPLCGCLVRVVRQEVRVTRELAAVAGVKANPGAIWDGRWRLEGSFRPGDVIAATGEAGLAACPDWRETGLPRHTLLATPAIWRGDALVSAPLAGVTGGFGAELSRTAEDFHATFRTH